MTFSWSAPFRVLATLLVVSLASWHVGLASLAYAAWLTPETSPIAALAAHAAVDAPAGELAVERAAAAGVAEEDGAALLGEDLLSFEAFDVDPLDADEAEATISPDIEEDDERPEALVVVAQVDPSSARCPTTGWQTDARPEDRLTGPTSPPPEA